MTERLPARRSPRPEPFEAIVAEVARETPDTVTLFFDTPHGHPPYQAGQFCTLDPRAFPAVGPAVRYFEAIKERREPPRAYSVCTAPHEPRLGITVKEEAYVEDVTEYPPLISPQLVHQPPVGMRLTVTGFAGPYVLPEPLPEGTEAAVHVVAGSGAVPSFSILKDALHRKLPLHHTFLCSNKTYDDICFRDALAELQRRHPERLRLVHTLTREPEERQLGPDVRFGRVSTGLLAELIPNPAKTLFFVCGPSVDQWTRRRARASGETPQPRFLETVLEELKAMGVERQQVKREGYG